MLEEAPESGGLKEVCRKLIPSAAKILIGTNSPEQINVFKKQNIPFILIGNKPFDDTPAVYVSVFKSLKYALKKLIASNHKKIAYIGPTQSQRGDNLITLEKFYAYVTVIEETYGMLDHSLIMNTPPFADRGYSTMKTLLEHSEIDAVYVAFDHLCPGVYRAIKERGLNIPDDISVLSTDGLEIHLSPKLFSLKVDRYRLGLEGAKLLKKVIKNNRKGKNTKSVVIEYESEKEFYGSVKTKQENPQSKQ
jgi:DNA-binding LacI/PurR family transcriptional regulator